MSIQKPNNLAKEISKFISENKSLEEVIKYLKNTLQNIYVKEKCTDVELHNLLSLAKKIKIHSCEEDNSIFNNHLTCCTTKMLVEVAKLGFIVIKYSFSTQSITNNRDLTIEDAKNHIVSRYKGLGKNGVFGDWYVNILGEVIPVKTCEDPLYLIDIEEKQLINEDADQCIKLDIKNYDSQYNYITFNSDLMVQLWKEKPKMTKSKGSIYWESKDEEMPFSLITLSKEYWKNFWKVYSSVDIEKILNKLPSLSLLSFEDLKVMKKPYNFFLRSLETNMDILEICKESRVDSVKKELNK